MLSFLNGQNSEAYQVATKLEDLYVVAYELSNYQILGLGIDCNKNERENNYNELNNLIEQNGNNFSKEEIDLITNAYRSFNSLLVAVFNERKMNSYIIINIRQQYNTKDNTEKMFETLNSKINKLVTVSYIENKNGEFVENKIVGNLKECNSFNNVVIGCEANFDIDFLGEQTAIIEICDNKGQQLYSNKYLLDKNKRNMYDGSEDVVNGFRIASWSFYKARILDAYKQLSKGAVKKKNL